MGIGGESEFDFIILLEKDLVIDAASWKYQNLRTVSKKRDLSFNGCY